jgi:hypothetical protein
MNKEINLRSQFLLEFVKQLFIAHENSSLSEPRLTPNPPRPQYNIPQETINYPEMEETIQLPREESEIERPIIIKELNQNVKMTPLIYQRNSEKNNSISYYGINFGKLAQFVSDPEIKSIECLGPEANLVAKKNQGLVNIPIRLTSEEISSLLDEISKKTNAPIIEGILKVSNENLTITAVISDFVGSRFIIQKK